jgi:hypothetical protein
VAKLLDAVATSLVSGDAVSETREGELVKLPGATHALSRRVG